MSGSTFPGRMGANSNPFGSSSSGSTQPAGGIGRIGEEDENENVASPTTSTFGQAGTLFGGDGSFGGPPSSFKPTGGPAEGFPSNYGMGRRTSVSAESLNPSDNQNDNWTPPVNPKSDHQTAIIKAALSGHSLFNKLEEEQSSQLALAMAAKDIPAKDIKVIVQGDQGDYFYVVEKGSFDVYINDSGKFQPPDGLGNKVATINQGGSFGELALMYGHPRNATVVSAEKDCKLLQLDRVTFRMIVIQNTWTRRRMYEAFLTEVPVFHSLDDAERAKIADALQTEKFPPGHTIIKEGDVGEAFYLLESGEAEAFKSGQAEKVKEYKKGDFFGELALLNDAPRAASVVSKTEVKVARLGKDGFQRLLGPVEGILRRTRYDTENIDPLQTA